MKVRLSKLVEKGGIKMARKLQHDGTYRIPPAESTVVEMSDKSAQKYIEKGLAEAVEGEQA
jgi:hypothetical protein